LKDFLASDKEGVMIDQPSDSQVKLNSSRDPTGAFAFRTLDDSWK